MSESTCYTDAGAGQPCGKPVVAQLAIIPAGAAPDTPAVGTPIPLCMRHLLVLMYTNGVGADELAEVVDGLGHHVAQQIDGKQDGPAT
jgi:hypothetical protein